MRCCEDYNTCRGVVVREQTPRQELSASHKSRRFRTQVVSTPRPCGGGTLFPPVPHRGRVAPLAPADAEVRVRARAQIFDLVARQRQGERPGETRSGLKGQG